MDNANRKPNRLQHYDYSQNGAYFITICTKDKQKIFWKKSENPNLVGATRGRLWELSYYGIIVNDAIIDIPNKYNNVFVDKYVIMPNHIHMIILIDNDINKGRARLAPTISRIIQQTKGRISKQIGKSIWQKSFYDHIIRDPSDYQRIWQYIDTNPIKWELDEYYTE